MVLHHISYLNLIKYSCEKIPLDLIWRFDLISWMNEVVVWYQISKIDLYVLSGIANEQFKLNAVLKWIKEHDNGNDA